jgi:hypothetical protein
MVATGCYIVNASELRVTETLACGNVWVVSGYPRIPRKQKPYNKPVCSPCSPIWWSLYKLWMRSGMSSPLFIMTAADQPQCLRSLKTATRPAFDRDTTSFASAPCSSRYPAEISAEPASTSGDLHTLQLLWMAAVVPTRNTIDIRHRVHRAAS